MIRAAIVGVGRWGQNLVDCTQDKTDKIRFTTGVARTPEKAASFASRYGLTLVNDYAKALADPNIDAIVLATPHTQHAEQVVAAARAGKHVFTDKPFALTKASADAAANACADAKRVLAVGFNWRYQPALHVSWMKRSASVALSRWATIQPTTYRLKTSSMTYR